MPGQQAQACCQSFWAAVELHVKTRTRKKPCWYCLMNRCLARWGRSVAAMENLSCQPRHGPASLRSAVNAGIMWPHVVPQSSFRLSRRRRASEDRPQSIIEVYFEASRRDARMRQFLERAKEAGVRLIEADALRLAKLAGSHGHQGVAARVEEVKDTRTLDELLDDLEEEGVKAPLLLVLDGVTDPHNLGACLRVADGAGVHAVIAPKDHAAGINATVAKVASGAADTVPYFMVTNLARTLKELKERGIWIIGTSGDADKHLYQMDLTGPTALVLGAEGDGMRQLTRKTCDALVSIPMQGAVESLNVSVASGVCLYEALRQRLAEAVAIKA